MRRQLVMRIDKRRIGAASGGIVLLAAAATTIPTPEGWPLATGFGGMLGDAIASVITGLASMPGLPFPQVLTGIVCAFAGIARCRLVLPSAPRRRAQRRPSHAPHRARRRASDTTRHRLRAPAPVVTASSKAFELEVPARPGPVVKSSPRDRRLADDIARSMSATAAASPSFLAATPSASNCRTQARDRYLRELLNAQELRRHTQGDLPLALGKTIEGEPVRRRPHQDASPADRRHHRLGQVGRHQRDDPVAALQAHARECRFIMIDPKMLELSVYDGIPHLLTRSSPIPRRPSSR
jgi:hypothetical protein